MGGMITLIFKNESPGDTVRLGPLPNFRVSSNFIRDPASGQILARYHNHFWEADGKFFTRYDCPNRVSIHFEDLEGGKTDTYGPYASLWVADGSLHAGGKLFTKFVDQTLMWHDHQSDTYWPVMVLSAP